MGHRTVVNLYSEKAKRREMASKLDLSALKVKIQCPAMTLHWGSHAGSLTATGTGARSTESICPSRGCPHGCKAEAEGRRQLTRGTVGLRGLLRIEGLYTMHTNRPVPALYFSSQSPDRPKCLCFSCLSFLSWKI